MKTFLAALAWLSLATTAFAQGYLNPPVYATGTIFAVTGVTGSTTTPITNAYAPNNLNIYNRTAMFGTWHIVMPFPAFDGEIINIGCPGGNINVLSVGTVSGSGDSVGAGGPTTCNVDDHALSMYQFQLETNTWKFITTSARGGGGGSLTVNDLFGNSVSSVDTLTAGTDIVSGSAGHATFTFPAFCPSLLTDTPNDTVNVSQLSACQGTDDQSIALVPKGNGGLSLQTPDGIAMNPVGSLSVDLQRSRNDPTHVVSGSNSFAAGADNLVDGSDNFVLGATNTTNANSFLNTILGSSNTVTSSGSAAYNLLSGSNNHLTGADPSYSTLMGNFNEIRSNYSIAEGTGNLVIGQSSGAFGGNSTIFNLGGNTVSGEDSFAFGELNGVGGNWSFVTGQSNSSQGDYAFINGGGGADFGVHNAAKHGMPYHAFASTGYIQSGHYILGAETADSATAIRLLTTFGTPGNDTPTNQNQIVLPNGANGTTLAMYSFTAQLAALDVGNGQMARWVFSGLVSQGATAASTVVNQVVSIVPGVSPTSGTSIGANYSYADSEFQAPGPPGPASVAITADGTHGALAITVHGIGVRQIQWLATIDTVENSF